MENLIEELYNVRALETLLELGFSSEGTKVYRTGGVNSSLAYQPIIRALKNSGLVRRVPIQKRGANDVREAYKITRKGKDAYEQVVGLFSKLTD